MGRQDDAGRLRHRRLGRRLPRRAGRRPRRPVAERRVAARRAGRRAGRPPGRQPRDQAGRLLDQVEVELLYWEGCPSHPAALAELRAALGERRAGRRCARSSAEEQAVAEGFPGSPTIRVDGEDLFPIDEPPSLTLPRLPARRRPLLPHARSGRLRALARVRRLAQCAAAESGARASTPRRRRRRSGQRRLHAQPTAAVRDRRVRHRPGSSSRWRWPSRVLALGGTSLREAVGPAAAARGGRRARASARPAGARRAPDRASVRALACGRGGRIAAAWTEYRGHGRRRAAPRPCRPAGADHRHRPYAVLRPGHPATSRSRSRPTARCSIAYSVVHAVRGVVVSPCRRRRARRSSSAPASRDHAARGRDRAATGGRSSPGRRSTAGEERNEHRRIYAVTGRDGRFGPRAARRTARPT